MKITTPHVSAWLIGDPHLGRDFRNGTPLNRRGEREAMQFAQFREELATPDVGYVIMVGDLFDKPFVSLSVVIEAAMAVREAAAARPDVLFWMMAGNHDLSRQLGVKGAWQAFEMMVGDIDNVTVVNEPMVSSRFALYPWQWGVSAEDQVITQPADIAIGHWDLMSFGGDDSHMAPTQKLMEAHGGNIEVYSGHYHEEGDFKVGNILVHCTGSMQPYTHAEDPEGNLYVTLSLDEALERADDLKDMCVRILLQPGEEMPEIDCLQLTSKRADVEQEEVEMGDVGLGSFNVAEAIEAEFKEQSVPAPVQDFIKERMGAVG